MLLNKKQKRDLRLSPWWEVFEPPLSCYPSQVEPAAGVEEFFPGLLLLRLLDEFLGSAWCGRRSARGSPAAFFLGQVHALYMKSAKVRILDAEFEDSPWQSGKGNRRALGDRREVGLTPGLPPTQNKVVRRHR